MACSCCVPMNGARGRSRWRGPLARLGGWGVPIVTLALIPKCPGCVAAYVLLFTGVGVSLPVAAAARTTLFALCITVLTVLTWRAVRRVSARRTLPE